MPPPTDEQTGQRGGSAAPLRVGVDVGGTFTDLVAFDPDTSELTVVKLPSTPPNFDRAVIDAVSRVAGAPPDVRVVHGSTVAANALLQRAGEPVAFVTTEGFSDMLLIGRQNRPRLYALNVQRPAPLTPSENWFAVRERIAAGGAAIEPLLDSEIDRLLEKIRASGLRHVAVCLLFSFVNPSHERMLGRRLSDAGLTVSLSSDVLAEFREYERASTTVINASLRPTVQAYLEALRAGLPASVTDLRIMHSAGGTLAVAEAQTSAAKLVLSGPAGGVTGAAFAAAAAGFPDVITYDMGGTSTDVATIIDGQPQWTTSSTVDGLPIGLPALDIHTVGAGGGSIAYLDTGGALRVGPRSAGALPGPACYGRGGTEPTVTDANLVLGRIVPEGFAGGSMRVEPDLAARAIEPLAKKMGKSLIEAALGIVRVAENNMGRAIGAVTSRRGLDPRQFTLLSFGGAGGLHACALANSLEIPRVLVPPYCGLLSALGMVVAPPAVDVSRTVVHIGDVLNDERLRVEFADLEKLAAAQMTEVSMATTERFADVRFRGQSYEVKVPVETVSRERIVERFHEAYERLYGSVPRERPSEIVTLRLRRVGPRPRLRLPPLTDTRPPAGGGNIRVVDDEGSSLNSVGIGRAQLLHNGSRVGPFLVLDAEATTWVPSGWTAHAGSDGTVLIERSGEAAS